MGIYDRDYIRRRPTAPGMPGTRRPSLTMLSANTWIILICVAVFVIDGFLAKNFSQVVLVSRDLPPHVSVVGGKQYREIHQPNESHQRFFKRVVVDVSKNPSQPIGTMTYERMPPLQAWFFFSTDKAFRQLEFWRFIGFQFLHGSFTHLLFNMIGLFFFGPMVERYLGSKRYVAFYLLCGICGALMYLVLNLSGFVISLIFGHSVTIPGILFNSTATPLIGASAGVFGVLMAGAFIAPNAMVLLFFILPMRLRTLAYALVVVAIITVLTGGANAGGEAGHIGGAIAGFYFIRHPHHLHGFFDILGRVDPTSHHYHGKASAARAARKALGQSGTPSRAEVDRILDKVHASGLRSLTAREKRILREASDRGA
jgi:membrane associated rhomboid family serine protease